MATEENKNIETQETPDTATEVDTAEETKAEETAPEKTEAELLKEEVESLKDKMIRHAAEFDNFKKRTQKEREELYSMAVCDTIEKILPVKDNLERAVSAAEAESGESSMTEGVKMIMKQLDDILAAMGVEKIKTAFYDYIVPFMDKTKSTQVTRIRNARIAYPQLNRFALVVAGVSTKPAFLKTVITGLYNKKVMDAFKPPFNRLNGRKAGSSNSTTASLGYPM